MKIFDKVEGWNTKVNFVDGNNVVLGYDLTQDCCEHADWFISDTVVEEIRERGSEELDLEDYCFDVGYRREFRGYGEFDAGGMVVFRITNGKDEKFIHLFNAHNGYYSHGFVFDLGNGYKQEDYL